VPITTLVATTTNVSARSIRPPANVRTKTSRPTVSVPKGWSNDGPFNGRLIASVDELHTSGITMQARTIDPRSTTPTQRLRGQPRRLPKLFRRLLIGAFAGLRPRRGRLREGSPRRRTAPPQATHPGSRGSRVAAPPERARAR